ncbi:MAG: flagellar hook protein FlgE [Bdellovibrionales bacterium]|nr:flagellar hook protein FlgE [Bdellovibrionales bacterium]
MSIVNGLFAGRAGISAHGSAIAVVGDNISNASTLGYKASRAEFEDLIAGGQTSGRTIGSGSSLAGVTTVFNQGTLEFTNRPLDLAVDGNGFFVVANGSQRFYTRAGNFRIDSAGNIVDPNGFQVLGFPTTGNQVLQTLNINNVSSSTSATANVGISGNVNASSTGVDVDTLFDAGPPAGPLVTADAGDTITANSTVTYADLSDSSAFQTVVDVVDSLGVAHTVTVFFYKDTTANTWQARAYVNSEDVDPAASTVDESGLPRLVGVANLVFTATGELDTDASDSLVLQGGTAGNLPWNNGSTSTANTIAVDFTNFTQFSASSNITSITQDGQSVGAVTSVSIESDGTIFALLDNGESTTLGTIGLVNFSNPEGLQRVGSNLLQQSNSSGEPITGKPGAGTFGAVQAGSLELSTTDIATEFVKLITLQRGFQASSRIITTINQLLNEVIQLA